MNYLKIYFNLVQKASGSKRNKNTGHFENHHIKPKSLGGKKLVLLTPKEHYIAHFLLFKHFKKFGNSNQKIKMARAFNAMTFSSKDNVPRYTSKTFQIARVAFIESIKGVNHWTANGIPKSFGEAISRGMKNMKDEYKKFFSENMKKVQANRTEEQKQEQYKKVAELCRQRVGENNPNFGKVHTDEFKKKVSEKLKGVKKSDEHSKNISLGWEKRKIVVCPYCFKESKNASSMNRWHFENCKLLNKEGKI